MIKEFFSITESHYKFEIFDLFTLVTIANVALILMGFWFAPIIGIVNCIGFMIYNSKTKAHVNSWISQVALIILNIYFLTL